jgi:hypothetical protein
MHYPAVDVCIECQGIDNNHIAKHREDLHLGTDTKLIQLLLKYAEDIEVGGTNCALRKELLLCEDFQ